MIEYRWHIIEDGEPEVPCVAIDTYGNYFLCRGWEKVNNDYVISLEMQKRLAGIRKEINWFGDIASQMTRRELERFLKVVHGNRIVAWLPIPPKEGARV